jgi:hypothetical protein
VWVTHFLPCGRPLTPSRAAVLPALQPTPLSMPISHPCSRRDGSDHCCGLCDIWPCRSCVGDGVDCSVVMAQGHAVAGAGGPRYAVRGIAVDSWPLSSHHPLSLACSSSFGCRAVALRVPSLAAVVVVILYSNDVVHECTAHPILYSSCRAPVQRPRQPP